MPLLLPDRLTLCCLDFYFFYATAAVPAAAATTRFRRDEAPEVVVVFRAATAQLSWGSSSRICCVRQSVLQNALSPLRTANKSSILTSITISSSSNNATSASAKKEACARNDDGTPTCTCRCPCHRQDVFCRNSKRPRNAQLDKPLLRRHERQPGF